MITFDGIYAIYDVLGSSLRRCSGLEQQCAVDSSDAVAIPKGKASTASRVSTFLHFSMGHSKHPGHPSVQGLLWLRQYRSLPGDWRIMLDVSHGDKGRCFRLVPRASCSMWRNDELLFISQFLSWHTSLADWYAGKVLHSSLNPLRVYAKHSVCDVSIHPE